MNQISKTLASAGWFRHGMGPCKLFGIHRHWRGMGWHRGIDILQAGRTRKRNAGTAQPLACDGPSQPPPLPPPPARLLARTNIPTLTRPDTHTHTLVQHPRSLGTLIGAIFHFSNSSAWWCVRRAAAGICSLPQTFRFGQSLLFSGPRPSFFLFRHPIRFFEFLYFCTSPFPNADHVSSASLFPFFYPLLATNGQGHHQHIPSLHRFATGTFFVGFLTLRPFLSFF